MIGALNYEWMRIRTIRSSYWMSGLAVVLSLGVALLIGIAINTSGFDGDIGRVDQLTTVMITAGVSGPGTPALVAILCSVIGVLTFGHEYQHGMSKATLTAVPDRVAVFSAKALVLAGWVAAVTLLSVVLNTLLATIMLDSFSLTGQSLRPLLNYVLFSIAFSWAGMGLAAILRSQVGAMVITLVWPLVIEQIVFNVARFATSLNLGWLANLMPVAAGRRSIFSPYEILANPPGLAEGTRVSGLEASTLVFWLGIAIVLAAAATSFLKRDA